MFPHTLFSILAILALLLVSRQAAARSVTTDGAEEYLEVHSEARSEVGIQELEWSEKLAKDASIHARYRRDKFRCVPGIVDAKKYGVGSNQYLGDRVPEEPSVVVKSWIKSRFYYNHDNNSCVPANYPCRDYTQVVWKNSTYLGCAQAACGPDYEGVTLTVCFYYPPGNIPGESPY